MRIVSVGRAFPENYYTQEELIAAFREHWQERHFNLARLESLHRNVLVGGRYLALPLEEYPRLASFTEANDAYIRLAVELGARAVVDAAEGAGVALSEIDHLFFVTTTGVATPSIDARLVNRLGLRADIKRSPLFGLGCLAGAAGVGRAADYLLAYPGEVAVLCSVELCSLTLQRKDLSIPNIVATGLFGDGAAAVLMVGEGKARDLRASAGAPQVVATRSVFYPDTERVMGWDITQDGFRVVLSADVPRVVRDYVRRDVEAFLSDAGVGREAIAVYVCHPGGPKVLEAFREELDLPPDALELTWKSLARVGNLSSASVLMVLADTLETRRPSAGSYGLMMAMGPGFCSELVLLQW